MKLGIAFSVCALIGASTVMAEDQFEKDRQAILSMAGAFKVAFKFDEVATLTEAPASEAERSHAQELVKVVKDTGDLIQLQHLLLVDGKHVVKHWRQDWRFEDGLMHEYRGGHRWEPVTLSRRERRGTWTQAVFNVDDSPRYESVGRWVHLDGQSYWESEVTARPLPRREYKKRQDYDLLMGRNRHSVTADGWLHHQDNYKLSERNGAQRILAYETGLNRYERIDEAKLAPAAAYWEKREPFWTEVNAAWLEVLSKPETVVIATEDEEAMFKEMMKVEERYEQGELAPAESLNAAIGATLDRFVRSGVSARNAP